MNRSLKSARPESSTYSTSSTIDEAAARSCTESAAIFAPSPAMFPAETIRVSARSGTSPIRTALAGERNEPKLPLTRIVAAGNVAGEGAKIAALSVTERAAANAVLDEVEYVELSGRADFNDLFIDELAFPG